MGPARSLLPYIYGSKEEFMATIDPKQECVTLINVFTVKPESQLELVELLVEITEDVVRHLEGFISSSIHRGLDGNRVVNYAQWRSVGHFQAMQENPRVREPMQRAARLAESTEPHLYEVESSHDRGGTAHLFGPEARI
jgi:quinol monooxygenase YgiN